MRIWDALKIELAITSLSKTEIDPIEWLSNSSNIVLENKHGDLALFEYGFVNKNIYSGHYFFKSRGQQATLVAKEFLDELFNSCYNINVLMGLVPTEHRAARWMTRRVGFTSYGIEEIRGKQYELFIITKKEFNRG